MGPDGAGPMTLGAIPIELVDLVDRACDRFEAEYRSGSIPRIEAYLAEAPELARPALLRQLLLLELDMVRPDGPRPGPDDYRARFPDLAWVVDSAFASERAPGPGETPGDFPAEESTEDEEERARSGPSRPEIPGYVILDELGRGGMGIVYRASDLRLNRVVALKMILAGQHATPELTARFLAE